MKAIINGREIEAETLIDLKSIANSASKDAWVYAEDDHGQFGFCNDPECNCDGFIRYN